MMLRTSKSAGKLLVLLFCLLLASSAFAEVLISINPRQASKAMYPNEIAYYDISYFNATPAAIENMTFYVSVSEELILVEDGIEVTDLTFEVASLEPEERGTRLVKVKALQPTSTKNYITVDYGEEVFMHSISTLVDVIRNPVNIRMRLEKTAVDIGEDNTVYFDLENNSEASLQDLHVQLIVPPDFEIIKQPSISAALSPGQALTNNAFIFRPPETFMGRATVVLRVAYKEDGVDRIIEKNFDLDVGQKEQLMYLIIGVILGLIIVSYLLGKKELPKIELVSPLQEENKPREKTA